MSVKQMLQIDNPCRDNLKPSASLCKLTWQGTERQKPAILRALMKRKKLNFAVRGQ